MLRGQLPRRCTACPRLHQEDGDRCASCEQAAEIARRLQVAREQVAPSVGEALAAREAREPERERPPSSRLSRIGGSAASRLPLSSGRGAWLRILAGALVMSLVGGGLLLASPGPRGGADALAVALPSFLALALVISTALDVAWLLDRA